MKIRVNLPKSGMGIEEGTVARWLKDVGDSVVRGEPLLEVETAKAIQEVVAPVGGILIEISAQVGATVPINTSLGIIDTPAQR